MYISREYKLYKLLNKKTVNMVLFNNLAESLSKLIVQYALNDKVHYLNYLNYTSTYLSNNHQQLDFIYDLNSKKLKLCNYKYINLIKNKIKNVSENDCINLIKMLFKDVHNLEIKSIKLKD